jgi:hypothetical protein
MLRQLLLQHKGNIERLQLALHHLALQIPVQEAQVAPINPRVPAALAAQNQVVLVQEVLAQAVLLV